MIDPVSYAIGQRAGTSPGGGFGPEDEGKVVAHGALSTQTATVVNDIGEYDTTAHNRVLVEIERADGRKF